MNENNSGESAEDILAIAQTYGYRSTQVARWRRAGLLPSPSQQHLGRGKGTRTVYPHGTAKHIHALCRIRAHERRIGYMAWHLWWAGYEVRMTHIRTILIATAALWERGLREVIDPATGELSNVAWNYMDSTATVHLPNR